MKQILYFLGFVLSVSAAAAVAEIDPQRQDELRHMLLHDCGSCHGMTMKGGLGPALTPEALGDRSPEALAATVTWGRPGTPMPPFKGLLSDEEIRWLISQLLER